MDIISKVYTFIKTIINVGLDLSIEKTVIINQLNKAFKEQYTSGEARRLVVVSITIGESAYKHSMSVSWLRSGFMLVIQNDEGLKQAEVHEISLYILQNDAFVRQLMVLGFDTLYVKGKNTESVKFKLSEYGNPESYMLQ